MPNKLFIVGFLFFLSLAGIIEAACESGFQFYFQLSYLLPTILISVAKVTGDEDFDGSGGSEGHLEDLFNWRTFSIAASFVSISRTFCVIRYTKYFSSLVKADFGFKSNTRLALVSVSINTCEHLSCF